MFITIQTKDGPVGCHLNTVKPPRVVPRALQHKWDFNPKRGETATCVKCGCAKIYQKDWQLLYRLKGESQLLENRPNCVALTLDLK